MNSAFHINPKLAAVTSSCGAVGATPMGANAQTADVASLAERCVR
jgi:hypothetical protein